MFGDVVTVVKEVRAGLDRVNDLDCHDLTPDQLQEAWQELRRARAQLDAAEARVAGAWEATKTWAEQGAKSAAAAAARHLDLPREAVNRPLRTARLLALLPGARAALEAGCIEACHLQRIATCDTPRTRTALLADHVELVRAAMDLPWREFCAEIDHWLDTHDPDGPDPGGSPRRRLHASTTLDGGVAIDGWLDPVTGTIFRTELQRLEELLFHQEWATARQRLGRDPGLHELDRSPAQRRADALALMAERSAVDPGTERRGRIIFSVFVGYDAFTRICELTNGTPVRPNQLTPYLDRSLIERIVFDGPGHVAEISDQRLFRGRLRRAIRARDRHCQHPLCDEPADRCEIDHIIPAEAGGPTTQTNGRLLCGHHNRARQQRPPPTVRPP